MIELTTWVKANWILLLFIASIASAFFLLRHRPSNVASFNDLNGTLTAGQPTVVEFYSNF